MTIASEITRLQGAKADLKTSIEAKGVTVPSSATIDTYSGYVDQIQQGGEVLKDDVLKWDTSGLAVGDAVGIALSVGTSTTVSSGGCDTPLPIELTESLSIVFFSRSSSIYAVAISVDAVGNISYGTPTLLSSNGGGSAYSFGAVALSDGEVLLTTWHSISSIDIYRVLISGTTITLDSSKTISGLATVSDYTYDLKIIKTSSGRVVLCRGFYLYEVDLSDMSLSASTSISASAYCTHKKIGDDIIVSIYKASVSSNNYALRYDAKQLGDTFGTFTSIGSGYVGQSGSRSSQVYNTGFNTIQLNKDEIAVLYQQQPGSATDPNDIRCSVLSLNNGVIVSSSPVDFAGTTSGSSREGINMAAMLSDGVFIINAGESYSGGRAAFSVIDFNGGIKQLYTQTVGSTSSLQALTTCIMKIGKKVLTLSYTNPSTMIYDINLSLTTSPGNLQYIWNPKFGVVEDDGVVRLSKWQIVSQPN